MARNISRSELTMIRLRWIYLVATFGFLTQATDGFVTPMEYQNFLGLDMIGWQFGLLYLILAFLMLMSFVKYHKLNKELIKGQVMSKDKEDSEESK